jgi:MinD-like ATPase involved in chromosome partitioning or flagellar assembly
MSLLVVAAGKGSPGVTTTALVLAAVWPRRCVLAECDAAGGDLVFRLRADGGGSLAVDRGVVSLATAARAAVTAESAAEHVQISDGGLPVLVGTSGELQSSALGSSWSGIAEAFVAVRGGDVVADCGRLSVSTPRPVLDVANLVVLVCRATVESVAHTKQTIEWLRRELHVDPTLLVVGAADAPTQARQALRGCGELDVVGPLPVDVPAAAALSGEWTRRLDRTALVTAARVTAQSLDARLAERRRVDQPVALDPDSEVVAHVG